MTLPRVLYICHNHPAVRPGGAETYALELYQGVSESGEFEPFFLAKGGPPYSPRRQPHPGTMIGPIQGDPNQYFFYTDCRNFDLLYGTLHAKEFYAKNLHDFLLALRPDVVHFQHTLFLGYDAIRQVKNSLPGVPIVYTLHEYLPICHRQGQMLRTVNGEERCTRESPQRCHECFPEISPQAFFMRKRFIQSHLSLVDLFLTPSRFLQQRFVEWGLPREKLRYEEYGRQPFLPAPNGNEERPRNRFGYFGQINPYKGVDVLLRAMKLLGTPAREDRPNRTADLHVWIHGANLDIQQGTYQNEVRALLETATNVTFVGRYDHTQLPRLMTNIDWVIVPSIWWENSPLVIQEAFGHGRPILCSDIGAMAEKVADRVNGLHFRAGDPVSLARTIHEAASSADLWHALRRGIRPPYRMNDHVKTLVSLYRELLERKTVVG